MTIDYTAIGNAAAEAEDQTQMKEGGSFERPVPEKGLAFIRLQQYIEIGKQKSANPKYKDTERVMLRFELLTPKHMIEIEVDNEKKKIPLTIDVSIPKGGKTSKYGKLFTALNHSGKYNHFAQMVGQATAIAEIHHNVYKEGTKEEKTYANLTDAQGAWTIKPPVKEDPETGEVASYNIPELQGSPKVFLWENKGITDADYVTLWNELFIEGEYEAKDGKPAKSKNWIQDTIAKGLTFKESRLFKLLQANPEGIDLDALVETAEAEEAPAPAVEEPEAAQVPVETAAAADVDPLLAAL